ncbi:hypothetical protein [Pseudoduganella sp. RAF53_2]|uniref:hypothetical protein n=1 Tax=unclassified Pseudoduganella TaxID=2637179 RepID=UPI003F9DEC01
MDNIATRPVHLPAADLLDLEFHLMETRPDLTLEAFLTELLKRWLKLDKERTELRLMVSPFAVFNGKMSFFLKARTFAQAIATPLNLRK